MRFAAKSVWRNESGAIAAMYALVLPALIISGGVAFDYTRMAAMDSELQNAADQAALAAASQLDGLEGATQRAENAASALVANNTVFSNDGAGSGVTIASVIFYEDKEKTTEVTRDDADSDDDADAHFVEVTVGSRRAFYALTPIMGAISSGHMSAAAYAGLGSAVCKVPPVMICNPNEGADPEFAVADYVNKGIKLVSVGNGGGAWAPGNFGYLNTGGGSNGAPGLREALGWTTPPGDCIAQTGVDTKPGATVSVTDALNTRFDIYDSNVSCPAGGACPASINSVKDLLRPNNANGNNACRLHNSGWQEASNASRRYLPNRINAATPSTLTPDSMGHPRDMCHAALSSASGYCSGPIGDGVWDRNAYFRANYGWTPLQWQTNTGLGSTPSRYEVYEWEIANAGTTVGGQGILSTTPRAVGSLRDHDRPVCSSAQGYGAGITPGGTAVDRRRLSVAVVNCTANSINGSATNVPVKKWIDVFLVEPSFARGSTTSGAHGRSGTSSGDVYVEVIGEALPGGSGATAGQVVRRDVPYLIE